MIDIELLIKILSELGVPMSAVMGMIYAIWMVWKFIDERMKANDLMMQRFLEIHANSTAAFQGLKLVINKFADELRIADESEKKRDEELHKAINAITPALSGRFDTVVITLEAIQEAVANIQSTIDSTQNTLPLINHSLDEIKKVIENDK